jgi:hypothetical protein
MCMKHETQNVTEAFEPNHRPDINRGWPMEAGHAPITGQYWL